MAQTEQTTAVENKEAVSPVDLPQAADSKPNGSQAGIDLLLDVTLPITVVIGKAEIPIQHLLSLSAGSVLQMDKSIEEPADLYIKNSHFATGSIVVVDGKFGVRIKEIFAVESSAITEQSEQQEAK